MVSSGNALSPIKKKHAIIRVDGSPSIGMGHIMRCIALGQSLLDLDIRPVFVMKDLDPSATRVVKNYGFPSELISADSTFDEDVFNTLESARRYKTQLIFTDLGYLLTSQNPGEYSRYHQKIKNPTTFVVTIDVLYNGELASDLIVNPYFSDPGHPDFLNNAHHLNGPEYFLFRKEFIESALHEKEIRQDVKNILVSIGGSDLKNTTGMVIRALGRIQDQSPHVRVLLGPGYPKELVSDLTVGVDSLLGDFEILHSGIKMADLLAWADLAILGGGLTKYEAAMSGTPAIVISQFESEIEPNIKFASAGSIQYIGHMDKLEENDIRDAVTQISADYPLRVLMSKKGKALVDGNGVKRILAKIPKEVFL